MSRKVSLLNLLFGFLAILSIAVPSFASAQVQSSSTTLGTNVHCVNLTYGIGLGDTDAVTGGDVSRLQKFLAAEGLYQGSISGHVGSATVTAIEKWQSMHGLVSLGDPDSTGYGYVGRATRAQIACGSSSRIDTQTNTDISSTTLRASSSATESRLITYIVGSSYFGAVIDFGDGASAAIPASQSRTGALGIQHRYTADPPYTVRILRPIAGEQLPNTCTTDDCAVILEIANRPLMQTVAVLTVASGARLSTFVATNTVQLIADSSTRTNGTSTNGTQAVVATQTYTSDATFVNTTASGTSGSDGNANPRRLAIFGGVAALATILIGAGLWSAFSGEGGVGTGSTGTGTGTGTGSGPGETGGVDGGAAGSTSGTSSTGGSTGASSGNSGSGTGSGSGTSSGTAGGEGGNAASDGSAGAGSNGTGAGTGTAGGEGGNAASDGSAGAGSSGTGSSGGSASGTAGGEGGNAASDGSAGAGSSGAGASDGGAGAGAGSGDGGAGAGAGDGGGGDGGGGGGAG